MMILKGKDAKPLMGLQQKREKKKMTRKQQSTR
jgi:hypothetical protein